MISEVMDKNVVTIPATLASGHGIKPGSRLDWQETAQPDTFTVKLLPDYAALAASLLGAGRKHLRPGADPLAELARERADAERQASL